MTKEELKLVIQEKLKDIGQINNTNLYYIGEGCYTSKKDMIIL